MILVVGPFPPPVHGASMITNAVAARLEAEGIAARRLSTAPRAGSSGICYHLSRIAAYLRAVARVLGSRDAEVVYLSLSGGLGLAYDLAVVVAARLRGRRLVFHHHSFAYLNRPTRLIGWIVRAAGPAQLHVVLCAAMGAAFRCVYGRELRIEAISNIAFMELPSTGNRRDGALSAIGFLANISAEKGIDRFLDLIAVLRKGGCPVEALVGGPIGDRSSSAALLRRMEEIGGVRYLGPAYGAAKEAFFDTIDLFVFPTRYVNEAQPLVVYEAQMAGVPVAASERGCLGEMIDAASGLLLDPDGSDVVALAERILGWVRDPAAFRLLQNRNAERIAALRALAETDGARFTKLLNSEAEFRSSL